MWWYTRLPRAVRSNFERVLRALPEPMTHHSSSLLKKAQMFCEAARRAEDETPFTVPSLYSRAEFGQLAPELNGRGHATPGLPESCDLDDVHSMMATDALIYLPQDILTKVDRATMAYSLEARAPFLDTDVVDLAFSLPRRWHRRGISGKRMLRDTFAHHLPRTIWQRRKQGFAVPVNQWFHGALGDTLVALLREQPNPLDLSHAQTLLRTHREGRRDYGHQLWAIYVYLLWQKANFLQAPSRGQDSVISA